MSRENTAQSILDRNRMLDSAAKEMRHASKMFTKIGEHLSNANLDKLAVNVKEQLKRLDLVDEKMLKEIGNSAKDLAILLDKLEDQASSAAQRQKDIAHEMADLWKKSRQGATWRKDHPLQQSAEIRDEKARYLKLGREAELLKAHKAKMDQLREEVLAGKEFGGVLNTATKGLSDLTKSVKGTIVAFASIHMALNLLKRAATTIYTELTDLSQKGLLGASGTFQKHGFGLSLSAKEQGQIIDQNRNLILMLGGGVNAIDLFLDDIRDSRKELEFLGTASAAATARFSKLTQEFGFERRDDSPQETIERNKKMRKGFMEQYKVFAGAFGDSADQFATMYETLLNEESIRTRLNVLGRREAELYTQELMTRTQNLRMMGLSNQQISEFNKKLSDMFDPKKNTLVERTKAGADMLSVVNIIRPMLEQFGLADLALELEETLPALNEYIRTAMDPGATEEDIQKLEATDRVAYAQAAFQKAVSALQRESSGRARIPIQGITQNGASPLFSHTMERGQVLSTKIATGEYIPEADRARRAAEAKALAEGKKLPGSGTFKLSDFVPPEFKQGLLDAGKSIEAWANTWTKKFGVDLTGSTETVISWFGQLGDSLLETIGVTNDLGKNYGDLSDIVGKVRSILSENWLTLFVGAVVAGTAALGLFAFQVARATAALQNLGGPSLPGGTPSGGTPDKPTGKGSGHRSNRPGGGGPRAPGRVPMPTGAGAASAAGVAARGFLGVATGPVGLALTALSAADVATGGAITGAAATGVTNAMMYGRDREVADMLAGKPGRGAAPQSFQAAPNADVSGLHPSVQSRFRAMADEYYQMTGNQIKVTSARRTTQQQIKLYQDYIDGRSKLPAAKPGTSLHERGLALDIDAKQAQDLHLSGLLQKHGFTWPMPQRDPVHIQTQGAQGMGDPVEQNIVAPDKKVLEELKRQTFIIDRDTYGARAVEELKRISATIVDKSGAQDYFLEKLNSTSFIPPQSMKRHGTMLSGASPSSDHHGEFPPQVKSDGGGAPPALSGLKPLMGTLEKVGSSDAFRNMMGGIAEKFMPHLQGAVPAVDELKASASHLAKRFTPVDAASASSSPPPSTANIEKALRNLTSGRDPLKLSLPDGSPDAAASSSDPHLDAEKASLQELRQQTKLLSGVINALSKSDTAPSSDPFKPSTIKLLGVE